MIYLKPKSGHTIRAEHIEAPVKEFFVEWDEGLRPTDEQGCVWTAGTRWCRVMARTPEGALKVAHYHHFMGNNHRLLQKEPV